jgi:hypothetical protein
MWTKVVEQIIIQITREVSIHYLKDVTFLQRIFGKKIQEVRICMQIYLLNLWPRGYHYELKYFFLYGLVWQPYFFKGN